MLEPETEARLILERAGFDLSDIPGARRIVTATMGEGTIQYVPRGTLRFSRGELACSRGVWRIYLSLALSPQLAAFTALHELAHYHLGSHDHGDPVLEAACNAIAGALTAPRTAFERAVALYHRDWRAVATVFGTDCTCTVLRFGEVTRTPLALVSPTALRVRGAERGWHQEDIIRKLARARSLPPGMSRSKLHDNRQRVLLLDEAA